MHCCTPRRPLSPAGLCGGRHGGRGRPQARAVPRVPRQPQPRGAGLCTGPPERCAGQWRGPGGCAGTVAASAASAAMFQRFRQFLGRGDGLFQACMRLCLSWAWSSRSMVVSRAPASLPPSLCAACRRPDGRAAGPRVGPCVRHPAERLYHLCLGPASQRAHLEPRRCVAVFRPVGAGSLLAPLARNGCQWSILRLPQAARRPRTCCSA